LERGAKLSFLAYLWHRSLQSSVGCGLLNGRRSVTD
jgi:hypothetical protein